MWRCISYFMELCILDLLGDAATGNLEVREIEAFPEISTIKSGTELADSGSHRMSVLACIQLMKKHTERKKGMDVDLESLQAIVLILKTVHKISRRAVVGSLNRDKGRNCIEICVGLVALKDSLRLIDELVGQFHAVAGRVDPSE